MFLLTGVPGWLGNRLVEILSGQDQLQFSPSAFQPSTVRCLVLPNAVCPFESSSTREIIHGDLCDASSLAPFFAGAEGSILCHVAGVIHPRRRVQEWEDVNVRGTANVLEWARRAGVRKVILLSSNSQSGCNSDVYMPFTESSPYNPYLGYGRSKMRMEQLAERYRREYDLDITVLRACWFYGPHQPARQVQFFHLIRTGRFPLVGGGASLRSLSYVDDVCQAIARSIVLPISKGRTYWVASERPYAMWEIVQTVANVMRDDFQYEVRMSWPTVPSVVSSVAVCADRCLQAIGRYHQSVHVLGEMNKHIFCSVDNMRQELGVVPEVDLREGMRRSIADCVQRKLL